VLCLPLKECLLTEILVALNTDFSHTRKHPQKTLATLNIREFFRTALKIIPSGKSLIERSSQENTHWVSPDITIYRRHRSAVWQCRFKLRDGRWHRLSTGCEDMGQARAAAIKLAEQWSIREELGLPIKRPSFAVVANAVIDDLRLAASNSQGKVVYRDYITVIERYLIPFFGQKTFEAITPELLRDFDGWRTTRSRKVPKASTLRTHASALDRVLELAWQRGLLPLNKTLPALTIQGKCSQPRPNHQF
jgi:integrase